MDPQEGLSLPFITRDVLKFKHNTTFALQLIYQAASPGPITVVGATREGPFSFKVTLTNTRAPITTLLSIPDIPIWVSVIDPDNDLRQGDVFARLNLFVNGNVLHQLCSGWVFSYVGLSWPASNLASPLPDLGSLETLTSADPAAGDNPSYTVPAYTLIKIKAIQAQLTTDATVANRRVRLGLTGGMFQQLMFLSSVDHPASTTRDYMFSPGHNDLDHEVGQYIAVSIPDNIILKPNDVLTIYAENDVAGDDWSAMHLLVERYFWPS